MLGGLDNAALDACVFSVNFQNSEFSAFRMCNLRIYVYFQSILRCQIISYSENWLKIHIYSEITQSECWKFWNLKIDWKYACTLWCSQITHFRSDHTSGHGLLTTPLSAVRTHAASTAVLIVFVDGWDAISGQMQVVALRYQHTGHIRRSIRMPLEWHSTLAMLQILSQTVKFLLFHAYARKSNM